MGIFIGRVLRTPSVEVVYPLAGSGRMQARVRFRGVCGAAGIFMTRARGSIASFTPRSSQRVTGGGENDNQTRDEWFVENEDSIDWLRAAHEALLRVVV